MTERTRNNYRKLDLLRESLGDTVVLEELMQAMSASEAEENLDHVLRMYDLDDEQDSEND